MYFLYYHCVSFLNKNKPKNQIQVLKKFSLHYLDSNHEPRWVHGMTECLSAIVLTAAKALPYLKKSNEPIGFDLPNKKNGVDRIISMTTPLAYLYATDSRPPYNLDGESANQTNFYLY